LRTHACDVVWIRRRVSTASTTVPNAARSSLQSPRTPSTQPKYSTTIMSRPMLETALAVS
jgi:hypothetical protein